METDDTIVRLGELGKRPDRPKLDFFPKKGDVGFVNLEQSAFILNHFAIAAIAAAAKQTGRFVPGEGRK